ncbi:unnamed protein product [Clonostachys rosea]|uniref:Uncharacterized protein n=1 Tax=Bionectria ochroleuca TaxID=29856 RepID=A0ABY6UMH0_BIOOC|nr:unnamed protein product [Clonostachys rosea]
MPTTVKTFLASAEAHDVLQTLKADGVAIIKSAAQPGTIDAVLKEAGALPEGQAFGLAAKSPTFVKELMMNKLYHDLVKRILTDTCIIFYSDERTVSTAEPQLSLTATLTSTPGSAGWGLRRQDDCHHTVHPAKRETDFGISFAATPINSSNGALRVVVGSNQWKDSRDPKEKEEIIVELAKGDAILHLGSVFLGQLPNTGTETSTLLTTFSTPGWCRQQENQYVAIPVDVVQTFSPEIQRFIGYYVSRPYGGAVEHMEPLDWLAAKGDWTKYIPVDLV